MSRDKLDAVRPPHAAVRIRLKTIHRLLSEAYQANVYILTGTDSNLTDQRTVDARVLLELISGALNASVRLRGDLEAALLPYRPPAGRE